LLNQIEFNISVSQPIDTDIQNDIHGNRLEKRTVKVYDDLYEIDGWAGLKSIIVVDREVKIKGIDKITKERAYFISSLQKPASFFQQAI